MRWTRSPWTLAVGLLIVRALLLAATSEPHRALHGDEPAYDAAARSVLAGEGLRYHGEPFIWKPPLWPLTLAGVRAVFGEDMRVVVLVQGLLDAMTALLFFGVARRLYGARAGWITLAMVALWPPFARESRLLQTEPLYMLGVALTVAAFVRFALAPGPAPWRALQCGLAAGLAAMVRPNGLVPLAGLVLGWLIAERQARRRVLDLVPALIGVVLVVMPWTLRNHREFGVWIPLSTGGGEVFAMGTSTRSDGRWHKVLWVEERNAVLRADSVALGRPLTVPEIDRRLYRLGLERWQADPGTQLRLLAKRFWRAAALPVGGDRPALRLAFVATLLALYALALRAAALALASTRAEHRLALPLLGAYALTLFALSAMAASSRYTEPVRPLLMILAAGVLSGGFATPARSAAPALR